MSSIILGEERGKIVDVRYRLAIVEILRFLKNHFSYKELSKITGVNETTLCRYIKGSMIPSIEQAKSIWENISSKISIFEYIEKMFKSKQDWLSALLEPSLLKVIASKLYLDIVGRRITLIVTRDSPILSLATALSFILDKPIVIVSENKPLTSDYIVEKVHDELGEVKAFFIPKRHGRKREDAIIIWDIVKSVGEVKALVVGLEKARINASVYITLFSKIDANEVNNIVDFRKLIP